MQQQTPLRLRCSCRRSFHTSSDVTRDHASRSVPTWPSCWLLGYGSLYIVTGLAVARSQGAEPASCRVGYAGPAARSIGLDRACVVATPDVSYVHTALRRDATRAIAKQLARTRAPPMLPIRTVSVQTLSETFRARGVTPRRDEEVGDPIQPHGRIPRTVRGGCTRSQPRRGRLSRTSRGAP
jgi:hypothetical protein